MRLLRQLSFASRRLSTAIDTIHTDAVVIGAGVVGLAIARELVNSGLEVILLDSSSYIGSGTTSRNSGVIHAGIYYPADSLKAKFCVHGKHKLYDFCHKYSIPHKRLGKLIVASSQDQIPELQALQAAATLNGVDDLRLLSAKQAKELEPAIQCQAALFSPSTGIIDVHAYITELLRQFQGDQRGILALHSKVIGGHLNPTHSSTSNCTITVQDQSSKEVTTISSKYLVNAAGLHAHNISKTLQGYKTSSLPPLHLCKGNYFSLTSKSPFQRLVYPLPKAGGLGVHLTLDMANAAQFGPDTEWLPSGTQPEDVSYAVDPERGPLFEAAVREYYPDLPTGSLALGYAGIRPKVVGPGEKAGDFVVHCKEQHGVENVVALYGIESPGLTASLALAEYVVKERLLCL